MALKDHPPSWNEEKEVQSGKDLDEVYYNGEEISHF